MNRYYDQMRQTTVTEIEDHETAMLNSVGMWNPVGDALAGFSQFPGGLASLDGLANMHRPVLNPPVAPKPSFPRLRRAAYWLWSCVKVEAIKTWKQRGL